ncbi:MAG: T9SS type A sorting domain-containing protein, partial [Chitinophagaceae bacterium]
STGVLRYSHSDLNLTSGVTLYRLQQVDIDGRTKYSDSRSVRGPGQGSRVLLYPNPSSGTANLQFASADGLRDVLVTDMSGRVLHQWRGVNTQNLQLANLAPGVYSVKIIDQRDGSQENERLVVGSR